PYYADPARRDRPRVLGQAVERLSPYRELLADPATRFVGAYGWEVGSYVAHKTKHYCDHSLLDGRPAGQSLESFLEEKGFNLIYLEEGLLQRLAASDPGSPF